MLRGKKSPNEAVMFERLSKEYGWTPDQIRSMRVDDVQNYIDIIHTKSMLNKTKK